MATSLLGINLLFHGFIRNLDSNYTPNSRWICVDMFSEPYLRDYISYGASRIIIYIGMLLSYILIAISRPGSSEYFQVRMTLNTLPQSIDNRYWCCPQRLTFSRSVCVDSSSWLWYWGISEWTSAFEFLSIKHGTINWIEWSFNWLEHILASNLEKLSILKGWISPVRL